MQYLELKNKAPLFFYCRPATRSEEPATGDGRSLTERGVGGQHTPLHRRLPTRVVPHPTWSVGAPPPSPPRPPYRPSSHSSAMLVLVAAREAYILE